MQGATYQDYGNAAAGSPNYVNDLYAPVKAEQASLLAIGSDFPLLSPGLAKTFPTAFLMFCCGVFAVPIAIVLQTGQDPSVQQFVNSHTVGTMVLVLPVTFIIAFILHIRNDGQPIRIVITVTLILSCIVLLLLGESNLITVYQKAPLLASMDCTVLPEKYQIQQEWENARGFYSTCMSEKAKTEGISFAAAVTAYRMEDCSAYGEQLKKHPVWKYLAGLEENQRCAGWCQEEQPMWTKEQTYDACSPVAAQILQEKVEWHMKQVVFYTLFTLLVISVILISIHSLLAKLHIEW